MSERLLAQCDYEVRQAQRIRAAHPAERPALYHEIYTKYAREFPEVLRPFDLAAKDTDYRCALLKQFIQRDNTVVEVGPGRCELAYALAPLVHEVIGVDVTSDLAAPDPPHNFRLVIADGTTIPLSNESVDLVVSHEFLEHLHPDDALAHVRDAFRILKPGGSYICETPNIICGPHDCGNHSPLLPCPIRDGAYITNGLHLKEYTNRSLAALFRRVGFSRTTSFIGARGQYLALPLWVMDLLEGACRQIPPKRRSHSRILLVLLGLRMRAIKPLSALGAH
jgi:SAM-dependent methyltransferase